MHAFRYLILAALVCAVLAVSGCTTSSRPIASATPAPAAMLASLALTPADLPASFTLTESREKNASELSKLALDLGWQAGYVAEYTNNTAGSAGQTTIVQTLTVYPGKSIPGVISVINKQERSDTTLTFSDIPAPGIGDTSGGFTAHARLIGTTNDHINILAPVSAQTGPVQDFAEVWFSKGSLFEVIRMTGPGSDAATVTALARTACTKIP